MIGSFTTVTGVMAPGIGRFSLPGDNAGFCEAILRRTISGQPLRLESLTYVRPGERAAEGTPPLPPLVVNLLMQLRAYSDESNTFLRNQATLNLQLTNQLRQALSHSSGAVRARAGEIERAVRQNLYRSGEFQRAIGQLAKELKKNDHRDPELTVRLPGPEVTVPAVSGRSAPALHAAAPGNRTQETPALRASAYSSGESQSAGKLAAAGPSEGRFPPLRGRRQPTPDAETPQTVREAGQSSRSGPASRSGTTGSTAETPESALREKTPGRKRRKTGPPAEVETTGSKESAAARREDHPPEAAVPAARAERRGRETPAQTAPPGPAQGTFDFAASETMSRASVLPRIRRSPAGVPAVSVSRGSGGLQGGGIPVTRFPLPAWLRTPTGLGILPPLERMWRPMGALAGKNPFLEQPPDVRFRLPPLLRRAAPLPGGEGRPAPLLQRQYGAVRAERAPLSPAAALHRTPAGRHLPLQTARQTQDEAGPISPAHRAEPLSGPSPQAGPLPVVSAQSPGIRWLSLGPLQPGLPGGRHSAAGDASGRLALAFAAPQSGEWSDAARSLWPYSLEKQRLRPPWYRNVPDFSQTEDAAGSGPWGRGGPPLSGGWNGPLIAAAPMFPERTAVFSETRPAPVLRRATGNTHETDPAGSTTDAGGQTLTGAPVRGRLSPPRSGVGRFSLPQADGPGTGPQFGRPALFSVSHGGRNSAAEAFRTGLTVFSRGAYGTRRREISPVGFPPERGAFSQLRPPVRIWVQEPAPGRPGGAESAAAVFHTPVAEPLGRRSAAEAGAVRREASYGSMAFAVAAGARLVQLRTVQRYRIQPSAQALPEPFGLEGRMALAGPAAAGAHRKSASARQADAGARVIHRKSSRPADRREKPSAGESGGEDVLRAQAISPAKAAALNAAYSYGAEQPSPAERVPAEVLSPEAEERIASQVLRELNYNRMAAEVLDRVERRLRTERRKFGL